MSSLTCVDLKWQNKFFHCKHCFFSRFSFQDFLSSSFLWLCIITSRRRTLSVGVRPILVFTHFAIPWPSTLPYYGTCTDWCHNIPKPKCTMLLFTGQPRTKLHYPSSLSVPNICTSYNDKLKAQCISPQWRNPTQEWYPRRQTETFAGGNQSIWAVSA